jgi:hypothetical protein
MKNSVVFALMVGLVISIVVIGSMAEVPYESNGATYSIGVKKVTLNLNGYTPYSQTIAKPITDGGLLSYLAYSWYTAPPSSGGTTISSFSLTLDGISASGQYVKASSGAVDNTINVLAQLYSKPYNGTSWVLDGEQNWTDETMPFSLSSWTSPSYSLSPLNQSSTVEIPITISNAQSSATPNPFQQMISINPSLYTSLEASNLGNLRFYNSSGDELYAWLENYTGSTTPNEATNATIWVKLTDSIPANSQAIIYMKFEPTTTNFDGVYWGEAPQLSPTYAEYDNGQNVFIDYWNFKGTTLPSGWTASTPGEATVAANNGLEVLEIDSGYIASLHYGTAINSNTEVIDVYGQFLDPYDQAFSSIGYELQNNNYWAGWYYVYSPMGVNFMTGSGSSGTYTANIPKADDKLWGVYSWCTTSSANYATWYNYKSYGTATNSNGNSNGEIYIQSNGGQVNVYWIRVRSYPPNGVMPTAVVGATPGSHQQYDFAIKLTALGLNAITGSQMSYSTWLNLSSDLYWQDNIFRSNIFSISGMTPVFTLPMTAIYALMTLWIGVGFVVMRLRHEDD